MGTGTNGLRQRAILVGAGVAMVAIMAGCGGGLATKAPEQATVTVVQAAPVPTSTEPTAEQKAAQAKLDRQVKREAARQAKADAKAEKAAAAAAAKAAKAAKAAAAQAAANAPNVRGKRLDVAERLLDRAGIGYNEVGGGTFGIVVPSNWTVCDTSDAGDGSIDLIVDRAC